MAALLADEGAKWAQNLLLGVFYVGLAIAGVACVVWVLKGVLGVFFGVAGGFKAAYDERSFVPILIILAVAVVPAGLAFVIASAAEGTQTGKHWAIGVGIAEFALAVIAALHDDPPGF